MFLVERLCALFIIMENSTNIDIGKTQNISANNLLEPEHSTLWKIESDEEHS